MFHAVYFIKTGDILRTICGSLSALAWTALAWTALAWVGVSESGHAVAVVTRKELVAVSDYVYSQAFPPSLENN